MFSGVSLGELWLRAPERKIRSQCFGGQSPLIPRYFGLDARRLHWPGRLHSCRSIEVSRGVASLDTVTSTPDARRLCWSGRCSKVEALTITGMVSLNPATILFGRAPPSLAWSLHLTTIVIGHALLCPKIVES